MKPEARALLRWTELVTVGMLAGIAAAVFVGAAAVTRGLGMPALSAATAAIAAMAVAGLADGLVVGIAQSFFLRRIGIGQVRWAVVTGVGSGIAWAIGMCVNLLVFDHEPAQETLLVIAAGAAVVLGSIVGLAQWMELRRHLQGAAGWIAANSIAWVAATGVAIAILSSIGPDSSATAVLIGAIIAGIAVGSTVGVITGASLAALLRCQPVSPDGRSHAH